MPLNEDALERVLRGDGRPAPSRVVQETDDFEVYERAKPALPDLEPPVPGPQPRAAPPFPQPPEPAVHAPAPAPPRVPAPTAFPPPPAPARAGQQTLEEDFEEMPGRLSREALPVPVEPVPEPTPAPPAAPAVAPMAAFDLVEAPAVEVVEPGPVPTPVFAATAAEATSPIVTLIPAEVMPVLPAALPASPLPEPPAAPEAAPGPAEAEAAPMAVEVLEPVEAAPAPLPEVELLPEPAPAVLSLVEAVPEPAAEPVPSTPDPVQTLLDAPPEAVAPVAEPLALPAEADPAEAVAEPTLASPAEVPVEPVDVEATALPEPPGAAPEPAPDAVAAVAEPAPAPTEPAAQVLVAVEPVVSEPIGFEPIPEPTPLPTVLAPEPAAAPASVAEPIVRPARELWFRGRPAPPPAEAPAPSGPTVVVKEGARLPPNPPGEPGHDPESRRREDRPEGTRHGGGARPRVAIVQSDFNAAITDRMAALAVEAAQRLGAAVAQHVHVPGVFDAPLAAQVLAGHEGVDAVVVLGCVIQGETHHDVVIAEACARQLLQIACATGVPVAFGVVGPRATKAQAEARVGMGTHAMESAVRQWRTLRTLRGAEADTASYTPMGH